MTSAIVAWKAAASRRGERLAADALEQRGERGPRVVDEQAVDALDAPRQRVRAALAGRELEVDRRLRLVLGHVAQPEERGRGVEQAARGRGDRGVEPPRDLGPDDRDLARIEAGEERRPRPSSSATPTAAARPLGAEQVAQRHPVRAADRERAAGQRGPAEPAQPPVPARSATSSSPPQSVPSSPMPSPS